MKATTLMNLQRTMLSEKATLKKKITHIISFQIYDILSNKIIELVNRLVVASNKEGWGQEGSELAIKVNMIYY